MNKRDIMNKMQRIASRESMFSEPFFTCHALGEIRVSNDFANSYQNWLRQSNYFKLGSGFTITVILSSRNYKGKLKMFKEFLDQYEGEL